MEERIEIHDVIQTGLETNFTRGKVQCFLALKTISHGKKMHFAVKFDKSRDYADFSRWIKQLLDEGDTLQAIRIEKRIVMIGRGNLYKNNWYLSYKDGGGQESTQFPEFIIRNEKKL